MIGKRIVNGVDVFVGQEILIGGVCLFDPQFCGHGLGRAESREAIAVTVPSWLFCVAGVTCLRPILAVLRTPQRILDI